MLIYSNAADPIDRCTKCGSTQFCDFDTHDGDSTRRDCKRCGFTLDFVRWHESETNNSRRNRGSSHVFYTRRFPPHRARKTYRPSVQKRVARERRQ
jgi:hypothetical protein